MTERMQEALTQVELERREVAARLSHHLANAPVLDMDRGAATTTMARPLTPAERLSRTWWRFWYTARPIALGAVGSVLPTLVAYLIIGWNVVDEMENRGVEFTTADSYAYTLVSWPRALAVVQTVWDDHAKTLADIKLTLDEINSGRWERKPPAPKK